MFDTNVSNNIEQTSKRYGLKTNLIRKFIVRIFRFTVVVQTGHLKKILKRNSLIVFCNTNFSIDIVYLEQKK